MVVLVAYLLVHRSPECFQEFLSVFFGVDRLQRSDFCIDAFALSGRRWVLSQSSGYPGAVPVDDVLLELSEALFGEWVFMSLLPPGVAVFHDLVQEVGIVNEFRAILVLL